MVQVIILLSYGLVLQLAQDKLLSSEYRYDNGAGREGRGL